MVTAVLTHNMIFVFAGNIWIHEGAMIRLIWPQNPPHFPLPCEKKIIRLDQYSMFDFKRSPVALEDKKKIRGSTG